MVGATFISDLEACLPRKYTAGAPAVDLVPKDSAKTAPNRSQNPSHNTSQTSLAAPPPPPPPSSSPYKEVVEALYDYQSQEQSDLPLYRGMRIEVLERLNNDWWRGRDMSSGREGIFPSNYVRVQDEKSAAGPPSYYGTPQQQQGYSQAPPQQQGGYYPPPMVVTQNPQEYEQQQQQQGDGHHHQAGQAVRRFGSKLGNAAIFGAGATIGSDIVNSIF